MNKCATSLPLNVKPPPHPDTVASNEQGLKVKELYNLPYRQFKNLFTSEKQLYQTIKWVIQYQNKIELDLFYESNNSDLYLQGKANGQSFGLKIDKSGYLFGSGHSAILDHVPMLLIYSFLNPKFSPFPINNPILSLNSKILFSLYCTPASIKLESLIWVTSFFSKDKFNHANNHSLIDIKPFIDRNKNPWIFYRSLKGDKNNDFFINNIQSGHQLRSFIEQDYESNSIQYQFNDGTIVPLNDILLHPYCVLLPDELLPSTVVRQNQKEFEWIYSSSNFYFSHRIFSKYQGNILVNLAIKSWDYCQKNNIPVYLSTEIDPKFSRKGIEIKSIKFLYGNDFTWEIDYPTIMAQLSSHHVNEKISLTQKIALGLDTKTLYFHQFEKQKDLVDYNLKQHKNKSNLKSDQFFFQTTLDYKSPPHQNINNLISKLKNKYNVNVNIKNEVNISDKNIHFQFHLSANQPNELSVALSLDGEDNQLKVWNIPSHINLIFSGLAGGLGECFESSNTELAIQSKGITRQNDLKFLRHSGLYLFLLGQTLHLLENENKITKKYFQEQILSQVAHLFKQIDNQSTRYLPLGENEISPSLNHYCSQKVITLIKKWAQLFFYENHLYEYHIFSHLGPTYTINYRPLIMHLLNHIVSWPLTKHGQHIFLKRTQKGFSFEHNKFEISDQKEQLKQISPFLTYPEVFAMVLAIGSEQNIFVDGVKLQSLATTDFHTEFKLTEHENKIDWFELHPKTFFQGKEISPQEALLFATKPYLKFKDKFYLINKSEIPGLKWLDYFWEKLQAKNKKGPKSSAESFVQLPRSQVLDMLALRHAGVHVDGGPRWKQVCQQYDRLYQRNQKQNDDSIFPTDFKLPLKNYQKLGTGWLYDLYCLQLGGVLADDMGLGKTIQALGLLEILRLKNELGLTLVVVPTSLVYNWKQEISKFAPLIPIEIFSAQDKKCLENKLKKKHTQMVLLCTYGLLHEHSTFLNQFNWNITLFDEAQNLKNIKSKRTSSARLLKSKTKFCLTGTPMENHYGEYFSLVDLVVPGALGEYSAFMQTFSFKAAQNSPGPKLQDIEFLKLKTAPLVLRRMKETILDQLPPKTETIIKLPFERQQKKIYRDIAISWNDRVRSAIGDKKESKLQMLTALLRLRQVCSFPQILKDIDYQQTTPKFELLKEAVQELTERGESVLIFTNFRTTLEYLETEFNKEGISTLSISGKMSVKNRSKTLEQFEKSTGAVVMLMTLKTGGVGLNLTKASYVFHIEPWWNPAAENQATDRAHRIGQTRPVQVYRYIMEDSVEEKIQLLKLEKSNAFNALFAEDGPESYTQKSGPTFSNEFLSQKDFEFLLS